MKTINCNDYELVTHEGIEQSKPHRKRKKRIRPGSIFWYGAKIIETAILIFAIFCWVFIFKIMAG